MTARELIFKLTGIEDDQLDHLVVMAKDAEGNGFSPLDHIAFGVYEADSTWSGDFTEDPEELAEDAVPAICLGPVN